MAKLHVLIEYEPDTEGVAIRSNAGGNVATYGIIMAGVEALMENGIRERIAAASGIVRPTPNEVSDIGNHGG